MKLNNLICKNFGCLQDVRFTLPNRSGLFLLTGKNLESPTLTENGCGKSTIFDALTWLLYGKTSKNLKAGKLLTRGETGGYWVVGEFDTFILRRSWSPNSLTLNGTEIAQEELDRQLKLSFDDFLLTVHMRQAGKHFFDYSAGDKLDFLASVFDLNRMSRAADRAKERLQEERVTLAQCEQTLKLKTAELDSIQRGLAELANLSNNWTEDEAETLNDLQSDLLKLKDEHQLWESKQAQLKTQLETELAESKTQMTSWSTAQEEKVQKLQQDIDGIDTIPVDDSEVKAAEELITSELSQSAIECERSESSFREADRQISIQANHLQHTESALKDFLKESLSGDCPTCQQNISDLHVAKIKHSYEMSLSKLKIELDSLIKNTKSLEDKHKENDDLRAQLLDYQKKVQEWRQEIRIKESQRELLEKRISDLKSQIQSIQKEQPPQLLQQQQIQSRIDSLPKDNPFSSQIERTEKTLSERPSNPYIPQIDKASKAITSTESEVESTKQVIQSTEEITRSWEFWQKEFPKVRLEMIQEIVEELQIHFNQALSRVGLSDYSVELSTERELKDERIKRELNLKLIHDHRDGLREIDSDGLSGGERQRFRLASAIGVAELVKHRTGCQWPLMLMDEPSQGLSVQGVADLLDFLGSLSEDMTIILAEHKVADTGVFDGVYEVIKGEDGRSRINTTIKEAVRV